MAISYSVLSFDITDEGKNHQVIQRKRKNLFSRYTKFAFVTDCQQRKGKNDEMIVEEPRGEKNRPNGGNRKQREEKETEDGNSDAKRSDQTRSADFLV